MKKKKSPPSLKNIGVFIELPTKRLDFLTSKLKEQTFAPGEQIIRAAKIWALPGYYRKR